MLVLTRKLNESIEVATPSGEIINLKITQIDGNHVKVGVTAPLDCAIMREELLELPR